MTTLEISGVILASEFALVAWIILFIFLRRQRQAHHEDHHHAGAVMRAIESNEIDRRDALATLFESTYNIEGEDLEAKIDEYVAREKAFYNAMLSLYLERDGKKLKQLPDELTKVLNPWVHLTPTGMVDRSEIGALEAQKSEIAAELESTKETLEQLMDEYTKAFNRSQHLEEAPQAAAPDTPSAEETTPEDETQKAMDELEAAFGGVDLSMPEEDELPTTDVTDEELEAATASEPEAEDQQAPAAEASDETDLDGLADLFDSPSSGKA